LLNMINGFTHRKFSAIGHAVDMRIDSNCWPAKRQ
jgi:hypothetical protein